MLVQHDRPYSPSQETSPQWCRGDSSPSPSHDAQVSACTSRSRRSSPSVLALPVCSCATWPVACGGKASREQSKHDLSRSTLCLPALGRPQLSFQRHRWDDDASLQRQLRFKNRGCDGLSLSSLTLEALRATILKAFPGNEAMIEAFFTSEGSGNERNDGARVWPGMASFVELCSWPPTLSDMAKSSTLPRCDPPCRAASHSSTCQGRAWLWQVPMEVPAAFLLRCCLTQR